jgi:hypothetical protein
MSPFDLTGVPGVPETLIPDTLVRQLPANLAPAPWRVRCSAVVWWSRAGTAAAAALPSALRETATPVGVVGGLARYEETPVGPYDEVFGVVVHRTGRSVRSTVAFMAVDSTASLVGGRTNWSMPKTLARFDGEPTSGRSFSAIGDAGSEWTVSANGRAFGPPLPAFSRARVVQQFPDDTLRVSRLQARGTARLARVQVAVDSPDGLPDWLAPGRHTGALVSGIGFSLGEPQRH